MPLFSVVIPSYNRASLLAETLASVCCQRFTDYEVLVVDDGSTDDTAAVLAGYGARVRVFHQQNRGPGAARNLGCQYAQGRYLAFLDSDDLWFPWTLRTYAQVIMQTKEAAFIAGKSKRFSELLELEVVKEESLVTKAFPDYYGSADEWRWWGASSFVIRADALRVAGGFTDQWINGEDADLAMRLGVVRGFIQLCAPFTFGYRDNAVGATKNFQRTLDGVWHNVRAEQSGRYPGGHARRVERWRILTRHVRPVSLFCLRYGLKADAWGLYLATFRWQLAVGRWKYLAAFPFKALLS